MTRPLNIVPTDLAIVCPQCPTVLPYTPYASPKPQWGNVLNPAIKFTIGGRQGVPLGQNIVETARCQDFASEPVLSDNGPKYTLIIHFDGYRPFKVHKHAYTSPKGTKVPNDRAKVFAQIIEVLAAFFAKKVPDNTSVTTIDHLVPGKGGIELEDLVLLELRHVAKSSYQPIFGLKCRCPFTPSAVSASLLDTWLMDMSQWDSEIYGTAGPSSIAAYVPTEIPATDDQLAQWVLDFMSMGNTT